MQANSTTYTLDMFIVPYGVDRQQRMRLKLIPHCNEAEFPNLSYE